MEGECKVEQAVSYWSDGVIALSRLPESSTCQQLTEWEDIWKKKKKKEKVVFTERLTEIVQAFPCLVSYFLPTKAVGRK